MRGIYITGTLTIAAGPSYKAPACVLRTSSKGSLPIPTSAAGRIMTMQTDQRHQHMTTNLRLSSDAKLALM